MKTPKVAPADQDTQKKARELEDQLKRALADYQNLERRVSEERRLLSSLSSVILIEKFLPVLDNLENAQAHLADQGLEIVIKQFKDILTSEGLEEIAAEGASFDPNLHEATEVVEGEKNDQIVKVTRKGYKINDKVIRPAQVTVERKSDQNQVEDQVKDHESHRMAEGSESDRTAKDGEFQTESADKENMKEVHYSSSE